MKKEVPVDFVKNFEDAFTVVSMYLIIATSNEKPELSLEGADKIYEQNYKGKGLSQLVADALNRIERLKLNGATRISKN